MRTLRNHLEASPHTKVVVVTHNEGVDFLLVGARDESGELYESPVRRFKARGVDFRVCTNTLVRRRIDTAGIVPEATLVPSGIAEIGRLQEAEGYTYMRL
jgi:intracellular sulfur oxidation DsrE/DsrF family protein